MLATLMTASSLAVGTWCVRVLASVQLLATLQSPEPPTQFTVDGSVLSSRYSSRGRNHAARGRRSARRPRRESELARFSSRCKDSQNMGGFSLYALDFALLHPVENAATFARPHSAHAKRGTGYR